MSRKQIVLVLFAVAAICGAVAWAQASTDHTGVWTFQTTMTLPPAQLAELEILEQCTFEGTANANEDQTGQIGGTATMTLVEGPAACPPESSANMNGGLDGATMFMTLDGGNFGTAFLEGSPTGAALTTGPAPGVAAPGYQGTLTVSSGPFDGSTGIWNAVPGTVQESIPTLGPLGVASLGLLLAAIALLTLRGRSGLA